MIKTIASQRDIPVPNGTAVKVPTEQFELKKMRLLYVVGAWVMWPVPPAHTCLLPVLAWSCRRTTRTVTPPMP